MDGSRSEAVGPDEVVVRWHGATRLELRASEATLWVDLPAAEGGGGEAFRSVELLLGALGTCMAGTLLVFARNEELPVEGLELRLRPRLASGPNRVAAVDVAMRVDGPVGERRLASLRRVAEHCKIHATLERGAEVALSVEPPAPAA